LHGDGEVVMVGTE